MYKKLKVIVKTGNTDNNQHLEVAQGQGGRGQPLIVIAKAGAKYELQDLEKSKGGAPEFVKLKSVGKNLHIFFEGCTEADVIIENYYEVMPEGYNAVVGQSEGGSFFEYIAEEADQKCPIPKLAEVGMAVPAALILAGVAGAAAAGGKGTAATTANATVKTAIGGTGTGTAVEDGTDQAAGTLTVTGAVNSADNVLQTPASLAGTYGNFTLNPDTGAWTYTLDNSKAATQALSEGQKVSDKLTVTSKDGLVSKDISIAITGANDIGIITGSATGSVTEDAAITTAFGALTVTDADNGQDGFQTPTSLTGTYGTFDFTPGTGAWTYTLDNSKASVQALATGEQVFDALTVKSIDGTATQEIKVTINGQNEAEPAPIKTVQITGISLDTGVAGDYITSDNTGLTINATLSAALVTGEVLQYSPDNGATWTNVPSTSITDRSVSHADSGPTSTNTFQMRIANGGGSGPFGAAATQLVTIDASGPIFATTGTDVATAQNENIATTMLVYDANATDTGGAVSYSLSGTDASAFDINTSTGEVRLNASPDYESKSSYSFSVVATDLAGNTTTKPVTLAVNNVDEVAPTITSAAIATAIAENAVVLTVVYTAAASDTDFNSPDTATSATYSLKAGTGDAAKFSINSTSGAVTLTEVPDFETQPSYTFTVVATDAAGNASEQMVSLAVNNVDEEAPVFTSPVVAPGVFENTLVNTVVYAAAATDTDFNSPATANSVSYSLKAGTGDAAKFTIDITTGEVTLTEVPDFETQPSYTFTVVVTDVAGYESEQMISLSVLNMDEVAPVFTSFGVAPAVFEHSVVLTVVYTVSATDTDFNSPATASSVTYSLKAGEGDAAKFTIDSTSGDVTLTEVPQFAVKPSYTFTVLATDAEGNITEQVVSMDVINVNDAPTGEVTITGTSQVGQVLTATSTVADVDGLDTFTYSWLADGTVISGAAGTTYTLVPGDLGKTITARVNYTDYGGTPEEVTSSPTVAVVAPVVLDLNRDGDLSYATVTMDVNSDGVMDNTLWADMQDGVLVWDKYHDGKVHNHSQYAFTEYGGSTDLEGLAAGFDSNRDGVFSMADEKFGEFKVWQDVNQNGLSDAGEVRSLTDWGITSINLVSDGVQRTPAAGVTEAGRSTASLADGGTMLVADAAFAYSTATDANMAAHLVDRLARAAVFQNKPYLLSTDEMAQLDLPESGLAELIEANFKVSSEWALAKIVCTAAYSASPSLADVLSDSDTAIDLAQITPSLKGFELMDIDGSGNNSINLTAADVLILGDLSPSNLINSSFATTQNSKKMVVLGDTGGTVTLADLANSTNTQTHIAGDAQAYGVWANQDTFLFIA